MRTNLLIFGFTCSVLAMSACNNGGSTITTDSTTVTTGDMQSATDAVSPSKNITVHFDPSANYVDLKTGKPIKLKVDTTTSSIVEEASNEPVTYYVNPATNDTFDRSGRMVNRALIKGANGEYTIVESKITVRSVNKSSLTHEDTSNITTTEGAPMPANSKTKMKEGSLKQKSDSSRQRMKEEQ